MCIVFSERQVFNIYQAFTQSLTPGLPQDSPRLFKILDFFKGKFWISGQKLILYPIEYKARYAGLFLASAEGLGLWLRLFLCLGLIQTHLQAFLCFLVKTKINAYTKLTVVMYGQIVARKSVAPSSGDFRRGPAPRYVCGQDQEF